MIDDDDDDDGDDDDDNHDDDDNYEICCLRPLVPFNMPFNIYLSLF